MSSTVGLDVEGILDPLETIEGRGFGRYDVFRDWIDLMLSALQRDDDAYLKSLAYRPTGRTPRDQRSSASCRLLALPGGEYVTTATNSCRAAGLKNSEPSV